MGTAAVVQRHATLSACPRHISSPRRRHQRRRVQEEENAKKQEPNSATAKRSHAPRRARMSGEGSQDERSRDRATAATE